MAGGNVVGVQPVTLLAKRAGALLFIAIILLFSQPGGYAQTSGYPPLKLFKNYFIAGGDYVVGGVGLRGLGDPSTGLATGTITLSDVPPNADISAAFLYWMTIEPNATEPMAEEAYFRGALVHGKV